jgi:MFS family permease
MNEGPDAPETWPPGEDTYPSTGAAIYSLGLLFTAYVLSFVDRQVLALMVGPVRAEFGLSDFQFSLLQGAAFAVLFCIISLPVGRLADRISRRAIVAVSVFGWSVLTCACGVARTFPQLVLARMGVGAGEAGLTPPAYSLILDSFRPQHVGYAMAVYKTAVMVGGGAAMVIGGALLDYYDGLGGLDLPLVGHLKAWQATFVTIGAPGVVVAALLATIPEPTRKGLARTAKSEGAAGAAGKGLPFRVVARFLWRRRRVYLPLFVGSSLLAMAGTGATNWYPEMLHRNYGLSKTEAGGIYGSIYIVAGLIGVLGGPWLVRILQRRGHEDAYVRAIIVTSLSAIAPLAGSPTATFLLLVPATVLASSYLGVMAVSFQIITPNEMRGQTSALYILVTSIMGLAVGTSILAAFTDFVYQSDAAIHYSIASVCALFYPAAAALFLYCLPAFRTAVEEAATGTWDI